MERNYKDLLLTEVNRMKEIMGLKILNEAYTSGIDEILKKLFGISDEAAQKSASGAESVLKQFVGGTGSYDDIADYVARQTGGVKSVDNVVDFIKGQPEILNNLVRNSDQIMKNAANEVFSKLNLESILTRDAYDDIESLMALTINKNNKNSVISFIDNAINQLTPKRGSNPNIDELIKKLEDRKKLAQSFETAKPKVDVGKPISTVVVRNSDEILSDINVLFKDEPEIIDAISKIPKKDLENTYKSISELPESKIDELFEKIKESCGLKEAVNKDRFGAFCRASEKYTEAAYKGNIRMMKIMFALVGAGIGIYLITQYLRGEKITIPVPDVEFSNTPDDTESSGGEDEQINW